MKDNVQIANEHRRWLSALLVTRKANDDFRERPLLHKYNSCLEIRLDRAMMKTFKIS